MSEYLMREAAPLSEEEWQHLDHVVVNTARQFLVGRRFLHVIGPVGSGAEVIPVGTGKNRVLLPMQIIEADFTLYWRDIEANRQLGMPLELGVAATAALQCAKAEDTMIFAGLQKAAKKAVQIGDWSQAETPLSDVSSAIEKLVADDFFGPFAVILSPALYTQTERVAHGTGRTLGKLIKEIAEGGLFRSPLLGEAEGLVLSLGAHCFDLAVGQDLITAYAGNEGLDHLFKVLESVALRIKRPGAICKLGK